MKKKGLSHIEVILGFVIFMIAIFFLISSYEPLFKYKNDNKDLIHKLYNNFLSNTSVEVKEYYLFVENPTDETIKVEIGENVSGYGIAAIDDNGVAMRVSLANQNNGEICIVINPASRFITLRLVKSLDIAYGSDLCLPMDNKYKISTSFENEKILIDKVKIFHQNYQANPEVLKKSLDLPSSSDFEYNLTSREFSYVGKKSRDLTRENVYSTSRKISAINQTGSTVNLEVLFRIW